MLIKVRYCSVTSKTDKEKKIQEKTQNGLSENQMVQELVFLSLDKSLKNEQKMF